MSDRRRKPAERSGSDPTHPPKPKTSSDQPTLPEQIPNNLGFLWSIDAVEPIYDGRHPPRKNKCCKDNDVATFWFPPNRAKQFKCRKGNLFRWRMGKSQLLDGVPRPEKVEVASVFFQARQDNFLAASVDCTRHDVGKEEYGWCQIMFHHKSENLSEVDFTGSRFELATTATGSTWVPQVLPEVYNYDERGPRAKKPTSPPGGLCGKLALIIGMAAFSAEEDHAEAVVSQCFDFGKWLRHQFPVGSGRYEGRGVVATIYLDPDAEGITKQHLKAFEGGKYGPIFAATPRQNTPEYTTASTSATASPVPRAVPRTPYQVSYSYAPVGQGSGTQGNVASASTPQNYSYSIRDDDEVEGEPEEGDY